MRSSDSKLGEHVAVLVPRGMTAGALVGLADACDTVLCGWAAGLSLGAHVAVVAILSFIGACAGVLIGAACVVPTAIRFLRQAWSARHRVQASLAIVLTVATAGLAWGFRMLFVLRWWYVAGAGAVMGAVLALAALRYRDQARVPLVLWLVELAWSYAIVTRLLYCFSRRGAATLAHAGASVCLVVLVILALSSSAPGSALRWSQRRAAGAVLVSVVVLFYAHSLLAKTPHALRLVLFERTTISYRLFATLPQQALTAEDLLHGCAEVEPGPAVEVATASTRGQPTKVRGVILIMVDALRGDRVPSQHTPRLTALAEQAHRFTSAYTTAPVTRHAIESMMTGDIPSAFRARKRKLRTIRRTLSNAKIRTVALSDHRYLERFVGDFDVYERLPAAAHKANRETRDSPVAFERATHHLKQLGASQRFFLLVHFYDPHAHYVPNEMFDSGTSLEQAYDAEVAYADHFIGRLLDFLDQGDAAKDVAVVVVGDHGEEHMDHRYRWHRARVYDESVRVPLLVRAPGSAAGGVTENPVSVMDIAPTIVELLGLRMPAGRGGVSLLSRPRPGRTLFVRSDIYPTHAIIVGGHKVIANLHTGVMEHYDLERDPTERNNLADQPSAVLDDMRCRLGRHLQRR